MNVKIIIMLIVQHVNQSLKKDVLVGVLKNQASIK